MKGKIYFIENQDNTLLGLCFVLKYNCVQDDVFLAFKATNVKLFLYQGVQDGYPKWD